MEYCTRYTIDVGFEAAVDLVTDELSAEGFGVLSEIDVDDAFAEKLGVDDFPRYRILGACNPALAEEALEIEPDLGVLLPCNIVVRETRDDEVVVAVVDPEAMLGMVDSAELSTIASQVSERLDRVLANVPNTVPAQ